MEKPNTKFLNVKGTEFTSISIDDCARQCTNKVGAECNSFHYCFVNGGCLITEFTTSSLNSTVFLSDKNCDIYESNFLYFEDEN